MSKKTLHQLYAEQTGKVSDKWSLYLAEYERLLDGYRDKPIRLLEIGVQNGGSLDIWSKYFSNASSVIGCDVNQSCSLLSYDDPCISLIVGDANADDVCEQVLQCSPQLDIIIDDGSHLSGDIIKSFALYFPHVVEGGIYIAEDLHCSYWSDFQGGLFDPYSSISFFKRLADIINHEHWGIAKTRADILRGIFTKYNCAIDVEVLAQVHSVEFINSICVVRKAPAADNNLGCHVVSGSTELVVQGHKALHGSLHELAQDLESSNPWTNRVISPDEAIQDTELALANALEQVEGFNHALAEREEQIVSLGQKVIAYQTSTSWRLTKPIRMVGRKIRQIKRILFLSGVLFSNLKELKKLAVRAQVLGLGNIEHHLELLQSKEYAAQVSRDRGLSTEFMSVLVGLGAVLLQIKQWWFSNNVRREFSERVTAFFYGETKAWRKIAPGHFRINIDSPNRFFMIVDGSFVISGWGVDLNACSALKVRARVGKTIYQPHLKQREDVQRVFASVSELPLDVGFAVVPTLSIGLHRLWVDVESPDGIWIPVHSTLLFHAPKIISWRRKKGVSYKAWTREEQKGLEAELPDITRHMDVMLHKPIFTVVIDVRQGLNGWEKTLQSIRRQVYPHYDLRVLVSAETRLPALLKKDVTPLLDMSLADVSGDFVVFIESGQGFSSNALYEFSNAINQYPDLDLIYGDQDHWSASGKRCDPFYKPDWSPDYLETFNYIGFPACFRTKVAHSCFADAHLYDLALRVTERTSKIMHVAKILGHEAGRQIDEKTLDTQSAQNITALQGRLKRTGRCGVVREHELYRGCYDIQLELKREPLVSIIIPTAGKTVTIEGRQIDLITNVVDQIRNQSTYKNIEIIVVDNDDLSEKQKQELAGYDCQRLTYTEPVFNIPKKLNLGATVANGELLLLMNDDIEILASNWIERMVEHFEKPHVGVVGAKLLYPDGRTQHVGVVHNSGNPDHVRRLFPGDEAGYYSSTCGVRNFMAVTGAVMMTLSNMYRKVGGYSEELAISYNDADYCLKVQEEGLWSVYAPKVELTHMESQSRVASADICEVVWYQKRWAHYVISDPYYNEQFLTVASPTFVPHVNQRIL